MITSKFLITHEPGVRIQASGDGAIFGTAQGDERKKLGVVLEYLLLRH